MYVHCAKTLASTILIIVCSPLFNANPLLNSEEFLDIELVLSTKETSQLMQEKKEKEKEKEHHNKYTVLSI